MKQTVFWLTAGFLIRTLVHLAELIDFESATFRLLVITNEAYEGLSGFCLAIIYYWSRKEEVAKWVARNLPFLV
jgi:hypothetical protein